MSTRPIHPALCCTVASLLAIAGSAHAQCLNTKLMANDKDDGDSFGYASFMSAEASTGAPRLLVGAATEDNANGANAGAAYTFGKVGSLWGQFSKLISPDAVPSQNFGVSVGYADPYIIVGAPGAGASNAAYIFERFGPDWIFRTKVSGGDEDVGRAVAITSDHGGMALVGRPLRDVDLNANNGFSDPDAGVVELLTRNANGTWSVVDTWPDRFAVNAGFSADEHFGAAVTIKGDIAACGAPYGESINWPDNHGFVRTYRRAANGTWSANGWLVSNNPAADDHYGAAVHTDGTYLAIGAPEDDGTAAQVGTAKTNSGCVYIQRWGGSDWIIDDQIFASDATDNAGFGSSVVLTTDAAGNRLVIVGASVGKKAYIFRRYAAGDWRQVAAINDPDNQGAGGFGMSVAASAGFYSVGDRFDDDAGLNNQGASYVYPVPGTATPGDSCDTAVGIQHGTYMGCTSNATRDGSTSCGIDAFEPQGPDVWYSWTPTCTGNVIMDTYGSEFDTILSVHSGCPGTAANTIACNDDASAPNAPDSILTFNYTAGTTYYIRISGYAGDMGNFAFRIADYQVPANDNCANSTRVYNGPNALRNCRASMDGPAEDSSCPNDEDMGADVWFKYTATASGPLTVTTCGSNFDTVMLVYNVSCPILNSQALVCNDDSDVCGLFSYQSYVSFNATAGHTYTIRVGGYTNPGTSNTATGEGFVTVTPSCPCDFNGGGLSVSDIFSFLTAWFASDQSANIDGGSLNVADIFAFLTCWFGGCQ